MANDVDDESAFIENLRPENLEPLTTLGRGSYGKVVLASLKQNEDGVDDMLVAGLCVCAVDKRSEVDSSLITSSS
jgi:hypothetical protein